MKQPVSPTQKMLNVWAIILIIWALYRAYFKLPDWFDEFIAKPVVFILPVFYYITRVEKKDFFRGIDFHVRTLGKDLLYGLVVGLFFIGTAVFANYVKTKNLFVLGPFSVYPAVTVAYLMILSLATGVSEEILSRGFVLKRLYEDSKNIYTSSFFTSVLFFFLHVPILFTSGITGNTLVLFMFTDLILSLANSFIFLQRRSIVVPILIHALYNFSLLFYL